MSITIVTRAGKGAPLNATEHDANIKNIVAAIENTTSGHDHDGTNSKKITYSSITAMTSAQLAGIISDETGSGALVFAESPTLVTPTLGVATATSINKVAITAPATSATLTISDGVTATIAAELHVEAATHVNQDLTSDASPTFVTVKLSGLTDGYIPKHTADATGLENTNVYSDGNNVGLAQTSFGTSAAKVLAIGSGTAPTTSPADAVQMWSQNNTGQGASGLAQLYIRDEYGISGPVMHALDQRDCENIIEDLSYYPPVTFTWDPGSLADGVGETSAAISVPGVSLGGAAVQCIAPYDLQGVTLNAYVNAADSCQARLQNETTGTIDLASGTWIMQARRI